MKEVLIAAMTNLPTMLPTIRPAKPADLARLASRLATLDLFTAYDLAAGDLERRWHRALDNGQPMLVAVAAGAPIGICWYVRHGAFEIGAYLRLLAVATEFQGTGLGARLLTAYEEACAPTRGGWFLLTSDFNTGAQKFYARHGYSEVGRLPGFATPGVTELIYWKAAPPVALLPG